MRTLGAFIDWMTRNFLRLVIMVVLLVAVIWAVSTCGIQACEEMKKPKAPSIEQATYVVRTLSRTYYTNDYEWDGDSLILHGYWVQSDYEQWVYKDMDFTLTRRFRPMVAPR